MTMTSGGWNGRAQNGAMAEDKDPGRPLRRSFTTAYKEAILDEYYGAPEKSGERGAVLRREGLYTSHITEWRRAREAADGAALAPPARAARTAEQLEVEKLRRRNERLEAELAKTKLVLEITGKAHALLELISESAASDTKPTK